MTRLTPTRTLHDAILAYDEQENLSTHDRKNSDRCKQPKWRLGNKTGGVFSCNFRFDLFLIAKMPPKKKKGKGKKKKKKDGKFDCLSLSAICSILSFKVRYCLHSFQYL